MMVCVYFSRSTLFPYAVCAVRLYPGLASIKGSEWVVRGRDSWHIAASTSVVFANVPNGKDDVGPQAVMQGILCDVLIFVLLI